MSRRILAHCRAETVGSNPVYVVLWFDTEDYILPPSDDAAKRLADFLTAEGVHATFNLVGKKGRTLERGGRKNVIALLRSHEIGYPNSSMLHAYFAQTWRLRKLSVFGLRSLVPSA